MSSDVSLDQTAFTMATPIRTPGKRTSFGRGVTDESPPKQPRQGPRPKTASQTPITEQNRLSFAQAVAPRTPNVGSNLGAPVYLDAALLKAPTRPRGKSLDLMPNPAARKLDFESEL